MSDVLDPFDRIVEGECIKARRAEFAMPPMDVTGSLIAQPTVEDFITVMVAFISEMGYHGSVVGVP